MIEAAPSVQSTFIRRLFYRDSELRAGWRLMIFLAMVIGLTSAGNLVLSHFLPDANSVPRFVVREIMDFVIFLIASAIMGRFERRSIGDYGLPRRGMFGVQFWQGIGLGFGAITVLLLGMRSFGVFHFQGIALRGVDIWKWALIYAFLFVLVGLREEFRSRGYGLFTLSAGIGFWPAAIVSSALFGFGHRGNSGEDWIGLFNVGLFGMLACLLLRRTGNLWMPIGIHTAFDWGETYFYGVADSGQTLPGHLLNSSSNGTAWLSGGSVGPEGSVLCTALLVILILVCAALFPQVRYPNFRARERLSSEAVTVAPC
jgi:membrane protease YdiL (CAAX protease family)